MMRLIMQHKQNIQTSNYTFHDGILSFHNNFNKPLGPFNQIIRQATIVNFGTDFNQKIKIPLNVLCLKTQHKFNEELELSTNLEILELGDGFNKRIVFGSTSNIKRLKLGHRFNQPLTLPQSIETLILGNSFNKPLSLTSNLTHVTFGNNFNQPLVIKSKLQYLFLGFFFNKLIYLEISASIEKLEFVYDKSKNQTINAHHKIKCVCISQTHVSTLDMKIIKNASVVHLKNCSFTNLKLCKNIIQFEISNVFIKSLDLNKNIAHLTLEKYLKPIFLTKKLIYVSFKYNDGKTVILPKHLRFLILGTAYINNLPKYLKRVYLNSRTLKIPIDYPIENLIIGFAQYSKFIDNLPDGVKNLLLLYKRGSGPITMFNLPQGHQIEKVLAYEN